MSTLIAGTEHGISITRYARGSGQGMGFQVTWSNYRGTQYVSFDDEDKARAFYHLIYLSIDVA